jgi:UDP-N-acetylglucosamine--N-acetylmuramyl-(pentapeptide) pyrophosphoryl-undecaprenol N-acetylglucosamine transferase
VSEFSAVGVPAVYIPYPVGNGEQRFNAKDVVAAGGALLVDDADFTPDWVLHGLVPLLRDRALVAEMAAATTGTGLLDGADRMVDLVDRALAERAVDDGATHTPPTADTPNGKIEPDDLP